MAASASAAATCTLSSGDSLPSGRLRPTADDLVHSRSRLVQADPFGRMGVGDAE